LKAHNNSVIERGSHSVKNVSNQLHRTSTR